MKRENKSKGGESCDFTNDCDILSINSPESMVGGPYLVIHKDAEQGYALVALNWNEEPKIGIRWFGGDVGNPQSSGYPTWTILPEDLYRALHNRFPLNTKHAYHVDKFFISEITGEQLKSRCYPDKSEAGK